MPRGTQVPHWLLFEFRYRTVTVYGQPFQVVLLSTRRSIIAALQPRNIEISRFGLFPFRSPLLWESRLISFPAGTEMFHFPALALAALCIQTGVTGLSPAGFPHSEIHGSKGIRPLTVAYRSLSRLSSPSDAKASA